VRFVHDHQIPVDLPQAGQDILPLGEIQRGDDAVVLQPLAETELIPNVMTA